MSKLVKKAFKAVKKVASGVKKFVKKYWKAIAIAALVVFTAGAASVVAAGGTWGGALTSVGSTFSAGASALTGGAIGTSAATAAGASASSAAVTAGATAAEAAATGAAATTAATSTAASAGGMAGAINGAATSVGSVVGKGLGVAGASAPATAAAAPAAGMTVGKAMLIGSGVQAAGALYQGYEQKKAEREAAEDADNASYYGMNGKGEYIPGFQPSGAAQSLQPSHAPYNPQTQDPSVGAVTRKPLLNRATYHQNRYI